MFGDCLLCTSVWLLRFSCVVDGVWLCYALLLVWFMLLLALVILLFAACITALVDLLMVVVGCGLFV